MTPVTLAPNVSGTASSDSSIFAVPAICSRELVVGGVPDQERLAGLCDPPRHAAADPRGQELDRSARLVREQIAAERDRHQILAVAEEHAAVVVVDELPELVRDREPDPRDVVQPRELPGEALEHLQVRDRAHVVAPRVLLRRPLELRPRRTGG